MKVQSKEFRLKGLPVSEGVSIGTLVILPSHAEERITEYTIQEKNVDFEVERYLKAVNSSRDDLRFLQLSLEQEGAKDAMDVIEAHIQMLHDPLITEGVELEIRRSCRNAEFVFHKMIKEYQQRFSRIKDPFFQERMVDVFDMSKRIFDHLFQKAKVSFSDIPHSAIIFSKELAPSHTAAIQMMPIGGFLTQMGGVSTHAALIARAKGIPYICHIDGERIASYQGTTIIIDGSAGEIIFCPDEETLARYNEIKARESTTYKLLEQEANPVTKTLDGYQVKVQANVGGVSDFIDMQLQSIDGIGLFRSEYLFLQKNITFASEEDQFKAYKEVLEQAGNTPFVMRVFDVGGDKNPDLFLEQAKEANPALGCRGIRFLLKHTSIFRTQLRAIMKAAGKKEVKILLPLVSDIEEIRRAKELIEQVRVELEREGCDIRQHFLVGCMIEVPSLVFLIDAVASEVDFLSIGTNDLIQYTLGIDRGNQNMSSLFYPAHPSLIRMIKMITVAADKKETPLTICGELASNPRFVPLLLGLGIKEFSCSPRHIPLVKKAVRSLSMLQVSEFGKKILLLSTAKEVEEALEAFLSQ